MNPTGIEWTDRTWNPVTGCLRGCSYCYARRVAKRFGKMPPARRFEPEFHVERLELPARRIVPTKVFVCSMADLFGPWVPDSWILDVIATAAAAHWHTFQFLTKYPDRLKAFAFPANCWVGVSVTDYDDSAEAALAMASIRASVRFMSAEPLLGHVAIFKHWIPDWIIIGRQTGPGSKPPPISAVGHLEAQADSYDIPIFHKPGLRAGGRREFPGGS